MIFPTKRPFQALAAWIPIVCIASCGCSDQAAREQSHEVALPAAQASKKLTASKELRLRTPPDRSFAVEEYIALGLPAPDRSWSGTDLARSYQVLADVAKQDPGHLPRYRSERSGSAFARLTEARNLEFYRTRSIPMEGRFPEAIRYQQATSQYLKLYMAAFLKGEVGDGELVEIVGAGLRVQVVLLELIDEFLPTVRKDDPSYEIRLGGLEKMKRAVAGQVAGSLQTLGDTDSLRSSERLRLLGYLKETFPMLVPSLPPGSRAETRVTLGTMIKDDRLKDLRPGLEELRAMIHPDEKRAVR